MTVAEFCNKVYTCADNVNKPIIILDFDDDFDPPSDYNLYTSDEHILTLHKGPYRIESICQKWIWEREIERVYWLEQGFAVMVADSETKRSESK